MARRLKRGPALPDWHLWGEVKRTVTPLRRDTTPGLLREPAAPLPLPVPQPPPPVFDKAARRQGTGLPAYRPPVDRPAPKRRAEDPAGPIEPNMRKRLARGRIEIDATIDLHGMHQSEARQALQRFVPARAARGDRTLLVITGKGLKKTGDLLILDRGVLRAMLPYWLAEPELAPFIAGWDAAARQHGGAGAFYLRLRRGTK